MLTRTGHARTSLQGPGQGLDLQGQGQGLDSQGQGLHLQLLTASCS